MKIVEASFKEIPLSVVTRRYHGMTVDQAADAFKRWSGQEAAVVYVLERGIIAIPFVPGTFTPRQRG